MNDKEKTPRATAVQADRLNFLKHEIERVGREADNYLSLLQEQHELMFGYDWLDEVFEENGKKDCAMFAAKWWCRSSMMISSYHDPIICP